jgi:hypothetical protein
MTDLQTKNDPQSPGMTPEYEGDAKREDEELATLGGKTRLVPRKASSSAASSPTTASASPRSSPAVSNILPALSYASHASHAHLSPPHQVNTLPLVAPPAQPTQQVGWQTYDYHHHQPSQPMAHPHAHTHSQPQAPHTQDHMSIEHQAQPVPMRDYSYTQYWQHQQTTEYPYNGMHGGPSTTYMPASPGTMGFDYAASLRAESYLTNASSMPPQQAARTMQVNSDYSPGTDPSMAWHDLVAQFNHV